jgi:uncharacterized protein (TIGR02266 family)
MRTPITLKIKFKSSNLDQFIERYSVDVSRGGIFIRTKEPLPVGTQLRFEFQLQDASALIAGDGTVVWIREHDPARQGVAPGMGVRFDKLATDSHRVLDRILAEKQKRGDAQLESRFDAGVRASASASGTLSTQGTRVAGHNDFSGGDSRTQTPLPGAMPGLTTPDDEFGNESTRVMQNELVKSLADKTRGQEDLGNAFAEPEPTRKASVEELKLAVQGSAVEKVSEVAAKKPEAKVEAKPEAKIDAKVEKKPEAKVEVAAEVKAEKVEAKPEPKVEKKPEAKVEAKPEPKIEEKKPEAKPDAEKTDQIRAATAAPYPKADQPKAAARKRSAAPLYAAVALVALVGGYTVFRNRTADEQQQQQQQQAQQAQQPAAPQPQAVPSEPPKVAEAETPKPTETPTETPTAPEAKGDKPAAAPTPAEAPNPAKPENVPTAALEKPAGISVAIASDPAGATVTVDGKPVQGATPTTLAGLDAKKVYDVKVAMKGFHDWKVKLKPKSGDKIDAALVPNEKVVEVATTPSGADVVLDGKRVGKTPYTIHKLDLTKTHALEVKRAGFVPQTRSISATDAFESKGDKDVLAVAMTLEAAPRAEKPEKQEPAGRPSVAARPAGAKPATAKKPATKKPIEATSDKPAETGDKPAVDKPAAAEKPAATEKPAAAEKPTTDKPTTDKPAAAEKPASKPVVADRPSDDKPTGEKPDKPAGGIKVPSWMKPKPAESGGSAAPPASENPQQ